MSIQTILSATVHRPWTLPNGEWSYYQEWSDALFLHWQVDLGELKKFVPKEIEIDLFDGNPWVSLVAFSMEKVRLRNLPAFQPLSDFNEINIRTYVKHNGKAGVFFLSIEGGTKLSCTFAKLMSRLPYRFSKMQREEGQYKSYNKVYSDTFKTRFKIGHALMHKTHLDRWLTERYALLQDDKHIVNEFEIHHLEWPLFSLDLQEAHVDYPRFKKLFYSQPDLTHYSPGVQVLAWNKMKVMEIYDS